MCATNYTKSAFVAYPVAACAAKFSDENKTQEELVENSAPATHRENRSRFPKPS